MKHFLTILSFLVLASVLNAQHTAFENLTPLAPNTQEFQKYGDYPVGHYTGVPSISIPLYTIKSGDIEVPISLSYHASGIKTDQEATWVGLGWSLNAGGSISKQVKGYDDYGSDARLRDGGLHFAEELIELTQANKQNSSFTENQKNQYIDKTGEHKIYRDFHPDLYFFNFLNYSGQFIFNDFPWGVSVKQTDGLKFLSNIENNKEEITTNNEGFKSFDINGLEYTFNEKEKITNRWGETTNNFQNSSNSINGYNLSNIKSSTGHEVDFYYSREGPITSTKKINSSLSMATGHVVKNQEGELLNPTIDCPSPFSPNNNCSSIFVAQHLLAGSGNASQIWSKSISYPKVLDSIVFKGSKVIFKTSKRDDLQSNNSNKLSYLEIYNKHDRLIKGFKFSYKYLNKKTNIPSSQRYLYWKLCLTSLREYNIVDEDTLYKPAHEFYYTEDAGPFYSKETEKFDSWGYFNNAVNPNIFIDQRSITSNLDYTYSINNSNWFAEDFNDIKSFSYSESDQYSTYPTHEIQEFLHEADSNRVKQYCLKEIKYPTKGKTIFDFEINDYRNVYDNFFTDYVDSNDIFKSMHLGYYNSNCSEAPCSDKRKVKFEFDGSYSGTFVIDNKIGSTKSRFTILPPNDSKIPIQMFHISETSVVSLNFSFSTNDFSKFYTVKGVLKNANMEPIFSISYNKNFRDEIGYIIYNHTTNIGTYKPSKKILLLPGTYYLEIENFNNQNYDYNSASLGYSIAKVTQPNPYFKKGGGLRIASISSYDTNNDLLARRIYDYTGEYKIPNTGDNGITKQSSGKLLAPILYNYEHDHFYNNIPTSDIGINGIYDHYSVEKLFSWPRPLTPMGSSANGQSIGYDQVTVTTENSDGENLGKTIYHYKNKLETLASDPRNSPNDKHLENGQLELQESFNTNGDTIHRVENLYSRNNRDTYTYGLNMRFNGNDMPTFGSDGTREHDIRRTKFTDYKIHSEWWHMDLTTNTTYDLNGENPIVTTTSYEYNNDKSYQPTKTTVTTSKGDNIETVVHYPDDITDENTLPLGGPLTEAEFNAIERLKFQGEDYQPATPIQTETTYNGSTTIERLHYGIFGGITQLSGISTATNNNGLKKQVTYLHYDNYGNPRELKRENGIHVVYVWGYEGEHLIAKIENATYNSLPTTLKGGNGHLGLFNEAINLSDDDTNVAAEIPLLTKLDEIRNHIALKDAMVTIYTYDPLIGMTTMTDPSGYKTSYTYDIHNRLHQVKDNEGHVISENQYNYKN